MIYLDNNATTRPAPEVVDAMLPWLGEGFGNPSSVHAAGRAAREALDRARATIGDFLGCDGRELCFVASGSEANALALKGLALASTDARRRQLVLTAIEHPSTLEAARQLEAQGFEVVRVAPRRDGTIAAQDFAAALSERTLLAVAMLANNETGIVLPLDEIALACRERGAMLHVDAVQAAGKLPIDLATLGCDTLSLAAHKLNGPKGAAALFVRRGLQLAPLVPGHQERGRRGGTEDVAAIVGFARACELARAHAGEAASIGERRDRLERALLERIPGASRNGAAEPRLSNTSSLRFDGCDGETLLIALDLNGVAASSGAACSSGSQRPSHVLLAMGLTAEQAQTSIRFSLSRETTDEELARVCALAPTLVDEIRGTKR